MRIYFKFSSTITIIILESLGTYVPIPSSSSSKIFDATVLFFKVIFVNEKIICFISMESHYVCGDMQWNGLDQKKHPKLVRDVFCLNFTLLS